MPPQFGFTSPCLFASSLPSPVGLPTASYSCLPCFPVGVASIFLVQQVLAQIGLSPSLPGHAFLKPCRIYHSWHFLYIVLQCYVIVRDFSSHSSNSIVGHLRLEIILHVPCLAQSWPWHMVRIQQSRVDGLNATLPKLILIPKSLLVSRQAYQMDVENWGCA